MAGESIDRAAVDELTMSDEVCEPVFKKQNVEVVVASNGATKCHGGDEKLSGFRVKRLAPEAILPSRGSAFSAGYDLSSAYQTIVPARGKALVKTELAIAIPEGTYARIAPRSGLAWNHSIDVGAGVIDFDYRGPVGVILFNHSDADFFINPGDRIAQLILEKIVTPAVEEVDDLGQTARGEGGFGSTGVSVSAAAEVTVDDAVDDAS